MSLFVLAVGTLIKDPEERTSAKSTTYVTATLRTPVEDSDATLVSLIGFSRSVVDALMAHAKGDSIAVNGRAKLTNWTSKDGQENHGMSVVVEAVPSPYGVAQRRKRLNPQGEEAEA